MKALILLSIGLLLAACGELPVNPVVASFNGDSVALQTSAIVNVDKAKAELQAEADRICKKGSKKRAEYASSRELPNYMAEHLYLCLN